jgi:hypothetical protein
MNEVAGCTDHPPFQAVRFGEGEEGGSFRCQGLGAGGDANGMEVFFRLVTDVAEGGIVALEAIETNRLAGVYAETGSVVVAELTVEGVVRVGGGLGGRRKEQNKSKSKSKSTHHENPPLQGQ